MDTTKYVTEFKQLEEELASGQLSSQELAEKAKRHAFLKPIIEKEQEINAAEKAIADDRAMIEAGEDKELVKMAADELAELEAKLPQLHHRLFAVFQTHARTIGAACGRQPRRLHRLAVTAVTLRHASL